MKPERDQLGVNPNHSPLKSRWWVYQSHRPELFEQMMNETYFTDNEQTSDLFACLEYLRIGLLKLRRMPIVPSPRSLG